MKRSLAAAVATITGLLLAIVPVSEASAGEYYNDYIDDLPTYVTAATPFTITVDGPNAVCSMTYNGTTLNAAPWSFVYDVNISRYSQEVEVGLCDGTGDAAYLKSLVPFQFSSTLLTGSRDTFSVRNDTDAPATVTVTNNAGTVVATADLPPQEISDVTVPTKVKATTTYTATATGANGMTMSHKVTVAKGWSLLMDSGAAFAPCSTLTWTLDTSKQPKSGNTMKKDITGGLARLAKQTGLTFVYTDSPNADIVYSWKNLGKHGPAGLGGYSWSSGSKSTGSVEFNTANYWTKNRYEGFEPGRRGPAGRGWLVIHETMHVLGMGHVNSKVAIMGPINYGQAKFTKGDLDGLHALYPTAGCPAS